MMESRFCIIIPPLRKARDKLGKNRGVSFAEMLLCVLILALSTGVTVSTLDLGIAHFKARTRETEQRLLCNTLSLAVQEYLTYANKIELNDPPAPGELPTLKRFRTGANSALENRWCEFVTGAYGNDANGREYRTPAEWGQIALEYSVDTNARYYQLADKSQYIVKKIASNPGDAGRVSVRTEVKLEATLDVKVDRTNKRFHVKISVDNREGIKTQKAENDFIVIPINAGAIPDPQNP